MLKGGGHAMAAGLTVEAGKIDALAEWLDSHLEQAVARASDNLEMLLDIAVAPGGLTPDLVESLDAGGPYGGGF